MPTPVGGATFNTSSPTTSLTFNYYPGSVGNFVILFLLFDGPVSAVAVTPYSAYAAGMSVTPGPVVGNLYSFIVQYVGYSPYLMFNWTGSATLGVALEEYSGTTQVSPTNYATASGTSGTASVSLTTDDVDGNVVVAGLGDAANNALTVTTGTQRQQNSSNTCRIAVVDNTDVGSPPGSLTCDATLTSSAWDAIIFELRYVIGVVPTLGFIGCKGRSPGSGWVPNTADVVLANNPAVPIYQPFGQTWPRG